MTHGVLLHAECCHILLSITTTITIITTTTIFIQDTHITEVFSWVPVTKYNTYINNYTIYIEKVKHSGLQYYLLNGYGNINHNQNFFNFLIRKLSYDSNPSKQNDSRAKNIAK